LPFYDADGDDHITPTDALVVINWLNARPFALGSEGEAAADDQPANGGRAAPDVNHIGEQILTQADDLRPTPPNTGPQTKPRTTGRIDAAVEPDRWYAMRRDGGLADIGTPAKAARTGEAAVNLPSTAIDDDLLDLLLPAHFVR